MKTLTPRKFYRLITDCGIRNLIHKFHLISAHTKNFADDRLHLIHFYRRVAGNDKIKCQFPFNRPFRYHADKGFILSIQIPVFIKDIPDCQVAVFPVPIHRKKDGENQFPRIYPVSHGLYLQKSV